MQIKLATSLHEIIKVEPTDFGIDANKAAQVKAFFVPMLNKMEALEGELKAIRAVKDITPDVCKAARDLRLKYKDVRCGTDKIHKELKAYYLNGGRFVDGWKNAQKAASEGREQELDKIERHFEIIEAERKTKLETERWALLCPFVDPAIPKEVYNLAAMPDDEFKYFVEGAKETCELKKAAEQRAIEEKKKAEHAEQMKQMQLKIENEKLRKEREALELQNKEKEAKICAQERYQKEVTDRLNTEREKNAQLERQAQQQQPAYSQRKETNFAPTDFPEVSTDKEILEAFLAGFNQIFVELPKFKNTKLDIEIGAVRRKVTEFIEQLIKENK